MQFKVVITERVMRVILHPENEAEQRMMGLFPQGNIKVDADYHGYYQNRNVKALSLNLTPPPATHVPINSGALRNLFDYIDGRRESKSKKALMLLYSEMVADIFGFDSHNIMRFDPDDVAGS